ncbi:mandelate racemase/muconate lactonizing enzyme family protein [Planosporangium sp. 12N6]|uniref:mandelate racemase/muconate lactonizing enzyme family protein n=1 Tax=Planosporangium spinosum TaxID=3402278 RepID=UPI003CFAA370
MPAPAPGAVIRELRTTALTAQPQTADGVLPEWAEAAVSRPTRPPWPETQRRYVIEVHDSDGAVGMFGPCSAAVIEVIRDQIAPALVGCPVDAWRWLSRLPVIGRHCSGPHFRLAVSAVELALWDLRSRRACRTVADLLGGRYRDAVPAYATAFGIDVGHPLAPDIARWIVESRFWGQKWRLTGVDRDESPRADIGRLHRLREAIGPDARLMIDGIGRWSSAYLLRLLPALVEADVTWVEEPLAGDSPAWPGVHVPLAAGEHAYDPEDQIATIVSGRVQVWQPDVAWHGGLTHALAMVDLAASCGLPSFPHASSLPAALHLAALCDDATIPAVEYHLTLDPRRHHVLEQPPVPAGGLLPLPDGVGLTSRYRVANDDRLTLTVGGIRAS